MTDATPTAPPRHRRGGTCATARVLFLSDTHLGFDLPARPRIERRRRGPDFFAAYARALRPALDGEVDLVVHGGDLLFRSQVPSTLVWRALEPLAEIAGGGTPVCLLPGNHERSTVPYPLLAMRPGLEVFFTPRTVVVDAGAVRVAVSGFPHHRPGVRRSFTELLARTGWREVAADVRLLCLHEAVEGARVGPADFTFRDGRDVIRGRDIPPGLAAVLSGHIHRHQVLELDLSGRPLAAPVLYPGSTERTSFAERGEAKGYLILELAGDDSYGGRLLDWEFHRLPTRPMIELSVSASGLGRDALRGHLQEHLARLDPAAIVRLELAGAGPSPPLTDADLRRLAPPTMNVTLRSPHAGRSRPSGPAAK